MFNHFLFLKKKKLKKKMFSLGEKINAVESHFPTTNLMLPLVLKRYGYNENLQPFRIKKCVYIPPFVNFNAFVNSDAADDPPCHCGIEIHYRLKLRSGNKFLSFHFIIKLYILYIKIIILFF